MKKTLTLIATGIVASSFLLLVGCNTLSGVGKDMQAGGKAMSRAANKTEAKLSKKSTTTKKSENYKKSK